MPPSQSRSDRRPNGRFIASAARNSGPLPGQLGCLSGACAAASARRSPRRASWPRPAAAQSTGRRCPEQTSRPRSPSACGATDLDRARRHQTSMPMRQGTVGPVVAGGYSRRTCVGSWLRQASGSGILGDSAPMAGAGPMHKRSRPNEDCRQCVTSTQPWRAAAAVQGDRAFSAASVPRSPRGQPRPGVYWRQ